MRGATSSGSSSIASRFPAGPASVSDSMRRATSIAAVIGELQVDPEIGAAQQRNRGLQRVAILARHAHEIAGDRSLDLELTVLQLLDHVAGLLDRNALL